MDHAAKLYPDLQYATTPEVPNLSEIDTSDSEMYDPKLDGEIPLVDDENIPVNMQDIKSPPLNIPVDEEEEAILQQELPDYESMFKQAEEQAAKEQAVREQAVREQAVQANIPEPQITEDAQPEVDDIQEQIQRSPQSDMADLIKKRNQEKDRLSLSKSVKKVASAFGGLGLGRPVKADLSVYKGLEERIDRPIKDLQLRNELEQEQAKNDPNSALSEMTRQSLIDLNLDVKNLPNFKNLTFAQVQKLYPTLAQALYTKLSAKAKVAEARIQSEAKKQEIIQKTQKEKLDRELKQQELDQRKTENELNRKLKQEENQLTRDLKREMSGINQDKKQFDREVQTHKVVDSAVEKLKKSDAYTLYKGSKEADALLEAALQSGADDYKTMAAAAFMRYAKTAQGDQSVVRNEDMKVLAGGMNIRDILGKIESKSKGSDLTPAELQAMQRVMRKVQEIKKSDITKSYASPIRKTAEKFNYDLGVYSDVLDEFNQPNTITLKTKKNPGDTVTLKDGSQYIIQKDGVTGVEK
jgi:hypothetical protein